MTARGAAIRELARIVFNDLDDHRRQHPAEADEVVAAMAKHIASWRPATPLVDDDPGGAA